MARNKSKVIYVNYSPYENAGNIFDYLLENFELVALFSFCFHNLGRKDENSKIKIYYHGKLIENKQLFDFSVSEFLIFLLLPIRSLLVLSQIFLYTAYLYLKYGKFDYYFTVNAFTAWVGFLLKKLNFVDKTVYWIWDYYPPHHKSRIIVFMRWLYWQFDKVSSKSDRLLFLNKRLISLRQSSGVLNKKAKYLIVPIGTNPINISTKKPKKENGWLKLGFLGVVKKSQGLELPIDGSNKVIKYFPRVKLEIIGSGPDSDYFKKTQGKTGLKMNFYGYLPDNKIDLLLSNCDIGLAPYIPEKTNVAYYGDPSKIKRYLSLGLPVITTNVFSFANEIEKTKAGKVIKYDSNELVNAIRLIMRNKGIYRKNAMKLASIYNYRKIYKKMFNF